MARWSLSLTALFREAITEQTSITRMRCHAGRRRGRAMNNRADFSQKTNIKATRGHSADDSIDQTIRSRIDQIETGPRQMCHCVAQPARWLATLKLFVLAKGSLCAPNFGNFSNKCERPLRNSSSRDGPATKTSLIGWSAAQLVRFIGIV